MIFFIFSKLGRDLVIIGVLVCDDIFVVSKLGRDLVIIALDDEEVLW